MRALRRSLRDVIRGIFARLPRGMRQPRGSLRAQADVDYTGFISYRRMDPDSQFASKLHAALERFRIPRSLRARQQTGFGRLFIDDGEAAAGRLRQLLNAALLRSTYLIVVCSTRTPQSPWVEEEVQSYLAAGHPPHRIIAVLLDGTVVQACPQTLAQLFAEGGAPRRQRPHLVAGSAATAKPLSRRSISRTVQAIAAIWLEVEPAALRRVLRRQKCVRWVSTGLGSFLALAMTIVAITPLNSELVWASESRRYFPLLSGGQMSFVPLANGRVRVTAPAPQALRAWEWQPSAGTLESIHPQWQELSPGGRFLLSADTAVGLLAVTDQTSKARRWLAVRLDSQSPMLTPRFAVEGNRVAVANIIGANLQVSIWNLDSGAEMARLDLGEVPDEPYATLGGGSLVPQPKATTWAFNAQQVWHSIHVIGEHLVAASATRPHVPVLRRLPSGKVVTDLAGGSDFALPIGTHGDPQLVAVLTASRQNELNVCIWSVADAKRQGCSELSKDPDADFEIATFNRPATQVLIAGADRLAVTKLPEFTILATTKPPEALRFAAWPEVPERAEWPFWTQAGSTFMWRADEGGSLRKVEDLRLFEARELILARGRPRLVTRYDRTVRLFDTVTWDLIAQFSTEDVWTSVSVTMDGSAFGMQTNDGRLVVARLEDGVPLAELSDVAGGVHRAFVDPSCRRITVVSGAGDAMSFRHGTRRFRQWFSPTPCSAGWS